TDPPSSTRSPSTTLFRSTGPAGSVKLAVQSGEKSGRLVIEAVDISKTYTEADGAPRTVLKNFSTRIQRGDRVGIIGANGAGKTRSEEHTSELQSRENLVC